MLLIDTHAHLDSSRFNKDRAEVIKNARDTGVSYIVNIGADLRSSRYSVKLAREYPFIFATVGIHPHDAIGLDANVLAELEKLAGEEKVVAIGEIGLDYYYDHSPRDIQRAAFIDQLVLAKKLNLPIVVHSREAEEDTISILKEHYRQGGTGILHCFSGSLKMAREALELGFYLAFGGIVTFKNAGGLLEVLEELPLDRILLETDCPYLSPVPYRGKRNEPAYLPYVAEKIGEIKGVSLEEVAEITTANAIRVYNLGDFLKEAY
ncbi:MAG TPA: TatD family hydrolase [Halanaerobiaceae bacterium]|nr:TatD family hydrolase [Halanaerobiaceae bacterium]HPZ62051.1 TatD family hydrolase [Halanaerobiales bacterium]HQD03452.1 TatD family hydrolase [Halanaerobiales bacterium]